MKTYEHLKMEQIIIERCSSRYYALCSECGERPSVLRMVIVFADNNAFARKTTKKHYYCIEHAIEWLEKHNVSKIHKLFDEKLFDEKFKKKERKVKIINEWLFLHIDD